MKNIFKALLIVIVLLFVVSKSEAQTVETIPLSQSISGDGIVRGKDGKLYVAGGCDKSQVYKIDLDGNISVISSALNGPTALIFKPGTDTLIISNWRSGVINTLSQDGVVNTFVNLPFGPGGMVFDNSGNLYVAHNQGANGQSGGIVKVKPDKSWSYFATGGSIFNPVGLVIDENENLYCANLKDGRITKIDKDGNQTLIATVPSTGKFRVGHLTYFNRRMYATALTNGKIYKITLSGDVSFFAGTGSPSYNDGSAYQASFKNPNGICFSLGGDTLFIRETLESNNRIRMIYDLVLKIGEVKTSNFMNSNVFNVYPNPVVNNVKFNLNILYPSLVTVSIYDVFGRHIETCIDDFLNPGTYEFNKNTDKLSAGVYFYRAKVGNKSISEKFIIQ